ncbi:hypothetical protein JB92DRAFT_883209 [Gautieria morchelliformis]|nr:hypothetical protein JB92DRAFT_883209 [Gautieria morchelliformis]
MWVRMLVQTWNLFHDTVRFCTRKDPNTQLSTLVKVNWCGDGVPEEKKGIHSSAVARYLEGTHVVNASTERSS